jgi:hypothetical protein
MTLTLGSLASTGQCQPAATQGENWYRPGPDSQNDRSR